MDNLSSGGAVGSHEFMAAFNTELTPAEAERLFLLAEEAAEVIQAVTKILRHGYESHNPDRPEDGTNRDQLRKEYIQFAAVGSQMIHEGDMPKGSVKEMREAWRKKLRYTHHQGEAR